MKFSFLFILLVLGSFFSSPAQHKFEGTHKGNLVVSAGYGAPSIIRTFLKKSNANKDYWIEGYGPLMLKTEYFVTKKWTVSANFTYSFSQLAWLGEGFDTSSNQMGMFEYGVRMRDFSAAIRTNYHFSPQKKLDKYVGVGFGYGIIDFSTYSLAPVNQFSVFYSVPRPLSFEATFGLRYFAMKRLGVYTEIGLGKSWLLFRKYFIPESLIQAGLSYRFFK